MLRCRLIALGSLLVACDSSSPQPPPGQGSTSDQSTPPATSGADSGTAGMTTGGATGADSGTTEMGPVTFGPGYFPEFCPPGVEPSLEMGHGDIEYRPIGDEIAQLVMGHQGGYHIVVGLRGQGLDLADWGSGHMYATIGGEVVADYETVVVMECAEDGTYSEALWLNLIFDAQPEDLVGQTTTATVEFTDASDVTVSATEVIEISEDIFHL